MRKAILKLDYICNNNCVFCHAKQKKSKQICSYKQILKKIELIKDKVGCIILSGGEPLLRKDFIRISTFIKRKGLVLGVITNSRIASINSCYEKLRKLKPVYNYATFHSCNKEIHEKITRVPGSFAQTEQGIKNLLKIRENLLVNIVILNQNIEELENVILYLKKLKVKNIKLSFVEPVLEEDVKHTPEITSAARKVREMLDLFSETDIGWDGFPLCLMKGYEDRIKNLNTCGIDYISEAWENTFYPVDCGNKIKPEACNTCKKYEMCEGIYKGYLDHKEFIPCPY